MFCCVEWCDVLCICGGVTFCEYVEWCDDDVCMCGVV